MIGLVKSTFYNETETKENLIDFIRESKYFSMGKKCSEFEKAFSKYQRRKHVLFFNSGSSANLALLQALKNMRIINTGDKIGYTGITWATNVMPIIQMGCKPVGIDINRNSLNITVDELKKHDVKVLFNTNVLGLQTNTNKIEKYCKDNGIILLEDCCESTGTRSTNNRRAGNHGLASTFSLYVAHHLSSIEGGIVCTNDDALYNMLLMVRAHGWDRNLSKKNKTKLRLKYDIDEFHSQFTFYALGYNLRPTEITGFIALEQMKYIDEIIDKRVKQFEEINQLIYNNPELIDIECNGIVSAFGIPIIPKTKKLHHYYLQVFESAGIETRPIIAGNIQRHPFFIYEKTDLPNTDFIHDHGFYITNSPELTADELNIIKGCL